VVNNAIEYLEKLLAALKVERAEDFEQYKTLIQGVPLGDRISLGYSWYPVKVIRAGYAIGERAFVIIERTTRINQPHQLKEGMSVNFFSQRADGNNQEKSGIINFMERNKMKIILNTKDIPDWIEDANLGIDLLFDERSYEEMQKAMEKVIKAEKDRVAELRSMLSGEKEIRFEEWTAPIVIPTLNDSQNEAVNRILSSKDVAIVHGPPGTGKTTTLVQAIKHLAHRENQVLVTAASNAAVDLLTEKLVAQGLNVVRIGNISRVDDDIIKHSLEYLTQHHPEQKNISKVRRQAAECRKKSRKFKRSFNAREKELRIKYKKEADELSAWATQLEDRLLEQILSQAEIIACTLVGAAHPTIRQMKFRTVVIDEAAQALETATWIPLLKSSKLVLAGDPFQLPPTVKSMEARKQGLHVTMIERCINSLPNVSLLTVQYRMNQAIMEFSNQQFYGGKLTAHESVIDHRLSIDNGEAVSFVDTAGCGFEEQVVEVLGRFPSRYNPEEYFILREHLFQLVEFYEAHEVPTIAIISPYREQVTYIQNAIQDDVMLRDLPINVNTIDGFQGQERDVVYISLVRSNVKGDIGFLSDYRRMNVAMTRARKKLIIIGDSITIGTHPFYDAFLNYCEKKGSYHTAWEFMTT
jgi:ATP-dependent RNA/DNA helicase IGHMBP2